MTPEKSIQNDILKFLKQVPNLYFERRQAGGLSYRSGIPDVWFVYRGLHVEVEVKAPFGTAGSLQLKHEEKLRNAGSLYWRGMSSSDFKKWFYEIFGTSHEL